MQAHMDGLVSSFVDKTLDFYSLAGVFVGMGGNRIVSGKIFAAARPLMNLAPRLFLPFTQLTARGAAFVAEASLFSTTPRFLQAISKEDLSLLHLYGSGGIIQGAIYAAAGLAGFKVAGVVSASQNFVVQSLLQSSAVMVSHRTLALWGNADPFREGLGQEWAEAQSMVLQLWAGIKMLHLALPTLMPWEAKKALKIQSMRWVRPELISEWIEPEMLGDLSLHAMTAEGNLTLGKTPKRRIILQGSDKTLKKPAGNKLIKTKGPICPTEKLQRAFSEFLKTLDLSQLPSDLSRQIAYEEVLLAPLKGKIIVEVSRDEYNSWVFIFLKNGRSKKLIISLNGDVKNDQLKKPPYEPHEVSRDEIALILNQSRNFPMREELIETLNLLDSKVPIETPDRDAEKKQKVSQRRAIANTLEDYLRSALFEALEQPVVIPEVYETSPKKQAREKQPGSSLSADPTRPDSRVPIETPDRDLEIDNERDIELIQQVLTEKSEEAAEKKQKPPSQRSAIANTLQAYFRKLDKFPPLPPEEELNLTIEYSKTKDPKIFKKLVTHNLRFVVTIAREYRPKSHDQLLDYIQQGNEGLMIAVERFDPHRGVRLVSYAVWWIRAVIREAILGNSSMVRMAYNQRDFINNLGKTRNRLEQEGIEPNVEELAAALGVKPEKVEAMQMRSMADLSLDAPAHAEDERSLHDSLTARIVPLDERMSQTDLMARFKEKLTKFAENLKPVEVAILNERLGSEDEALTLEEIGNRYNLTRERIRQIQERLLVKLKDWFKREVGEFTLSDFEDPY
jgi:RNA polymerase sigma-32 factor